jgi:Flp pilus assembly protein TadD
VTQQAREHLIDGQYQRAISLAERGLRMDRRHWESYRILAESHLGLGDRQQALKFARQAVRFCRSDCHGARELLQSLQ